MQFDSRGGPDWRDVIDGCELGVWDLNILTGERTGFRNEAPHPDDAALVLKAWNAHLQGATEAYQAEFRLRHREGHWVWVRERGRVYERTPDGAAARARGVIEEISREKNLEEELRLLKEQFACTIHLTALIPWTAAPDGTIISCEPVWEAFTGQPLSNALNDYWIDSIHPDDRGRTVDRWMRAVRSGEPYRVEHRLRRFDGEYRDVESRAEPRFDADGNIRVWYGSTEDVHERAVARRSLQQSETRLELAVEGAELATWDWNLRTGEVLRSARWFRMRGYDVPSGTTSTDFWQEQVHPEDLGMLQATWAEFLEGKTESYRTEFRIRHRSGEWRWIRTHGRVAERDERGPVRACGVNQDVTETRRSEEALARSERFSRMLLEANQDCQSLLNASGEIEYMNPAGRKRMGYTDSAGPLPGKWLDPWREEDRAALSGAMAAAFEGRSVAIQAYCSPENAAPGWWDVVFSPLSEAGDGDGRILARAREITEVREREEKQRALEEKERLQAIIENLNEGILIAEPGGAVLLMNRAARKMYGFDASGSSCDELLAMLDAKDLFGKHFSPAERPLARALRGDPFEGLEAFFRNRVSGREWVGSCGSFPVRSSSGALVLAALSVREITAEKKAADEVLRTNDMLHSLSGELLRLQDDERRRIARELHDGTVQVLLAELMNLNVLAKSPAIRNLEFEKDLIAKTLVMARQCVKELRTMSYLLHPPALEQLGLVPALRSWIDGFSERTGIPVDVQFAEKNIRLGADAETTLFRITQEALGNVHRHAGATTATVQLTLRDREIELEIRDDGKGFNAENKPGEEAPRFGVGLPGMRERARQLGGIMRVSSGAEGTAIHVRLPRTEPGI